jgi:hypothetical protein
MSRSRRNKKRQGASGIPTVPTYSNGTAAEALAPVRPLHEVFAENELLSVDPDRGFVVVAPKPHLALAESPRPVDFREIGATGQATWGGYPRDEYNVKLQGHEGLRLYDQMRRSDGQVRQSLQLIKTPVIAGRWYVQPASTSDEDREVADFVWKCFTEYMTISFKQLLKESLTALDFGHWVWEIVYEPRIVDGTPRIVWKKFAPRHPMDILEWQYDRNGGPKAVTMNKEMGNSRTSEVRIPIDKLVVITWDREGGNLQGTSILRGAYKHWYFKDNLYKIDAIQKERHGIGVPIIKLPPNFSRTDAELADQIGRNLRVNEKAHVVLPPLWELEFAKLEGQPVDAVTSIEHHNRMILANVLGEFTQGQGDTAVFYELFLKSARFVGDVIADSFNQYAVRQLVDYNYSGVDYPTLMVRRIGETTDQRTMSFALRNYVGADLIRADQGMEDWIRTEMDLPRYDESTDRKLEEIERQQEQAELAHARSMEQVAARPAPVGNGEQGRTPNSGAGKQKNKGAKAGLPRQTPAKRKKDPGSNSRVGGPSNNSASEVDKDINKLSEELESLEAD